MTRQTRNGRYRAGKFASSLSRSLVCEEDVESVTDEPWLEDGERRGGSVSVTDVSLIRADVMAETTVNVFLLRKSNKLDLSAD